MQLGKPPVVEVSIAFFFESSAGDPEWEVNRAAEFFGQFQSDYPETEIATLHQLSEVKKLPRGSKPLLETKQVPVAFRAFPADRSRYLLNAKDVLRCIFARTDKNDYPGFSAIKAEALAKLAAYIAFFRPSKLIAFSLRYVDLVRLPLVEGRAELRDFFTICGEPDEQTFGQTVWFRKAFSTRPPNSRDLLSCELYNVLKTPDSKNPAITFRIEWELQGSEANWDAPALESRLNAAHGWLLHCFRKSFTDRGWALFEPRDDAG